ncbi:indole-3-glycerol phosphate synthase TrpC [Anaerosacchariphilus sp. NSJ-68]|uniref:Indole-3-glycerol phosphate synthase n=2 Tax=Lachnospiraceae TaxID=186803 RepID=A0A923LER6_9FIRM|nr:MULTISPECIES: indole-3-glycerol phosphate synthase TrpC [Lachnospiraceae]MBC5660722.1 indole-3-glycerol phosphate synthase TrpC [Anaerosacchariphilus hominis]MBC5697943.1 indole-3-glycerol phosphate synthase TrpC [Roseburia difficilis]
MNILEEIAGKTRERIEAEKRQCCPAEMRVLAEERLRTEKSGGAEVLAGAAGGRFYRALAAPGMSYICEVKKASPSKGLIASDFPYLEIAKEYEAAGAAAISCLTEPFYFQGSDRYLKEITDTVGIPVLRKDFTVDEYMIYQAKTLGASAVLLICAILDKVQLRDYRQLAESLGLDALVEAHDEREVEMALDMGAKIVGVNNRDLKTFQVDMQNSIRLRNLAPREVLFVSESGIKGPEEISILREHQIDAVLIGETLMRSVDKKAELERLNGSPLKR